MDPPATDPSATDPSATDPPATDPPATDPPDPAVDSTAYDAIGGLTPSSANYRQAVEVLSKRFGPCGHSHDHHLRELHQLYDKTEPHVCSLEPLGIKLRKGAPHLGARSAKGNTTLPSVMLIAANLVTLP